MPYYFNETKIAVIWDETNFDNVFEYNPVYDIQF